MARYAAQRLRRLEQQLAVIASRRWSMAPVVDAYQAMPFLVALVVAAIASPY